MTLLLDSVSGRLAAEARSVITAGLEEYRQLFAGLPRDGSGSAAATLRVELISGVAGEGNSDPGIVTVTVSERPLFGWDDWRVILLHELFHLWSAESFRYQDDREQWFNEGAAEHYSVRSRVGHLPAPGAG